MNKQEQEYALILEARKRAGEVHDWRFEALKLRLATKAFYSPDFLVIAADGAVELHEVKGHIEDDAATKMRVVVDQYPYFRFVLATKKGGAWSIKEMGP